MRIEKLTSSLLTIGNQEETIQRWFVKSRMSVFESDLSREENVGSIRWKEGASLLSSIMVKTTIHRIEIDF